MELLELCEQYFNTNNLYEVLQISENATEKEVKKAYHKLSLKVHPDRVNEDKKLEATEKFKVLGAVLAILIDKAKRANYNETKYVDDEDVITSHEWEVYWNLNFTKIATDYNYQKQYRGSDEEKDYLKYLYLTGKGDMDYIFEKMEFATTDSEPRVRVILTKMIEKGEIPAYEMFTQEPNKNGIREMLRKIEKYKWHRK